MSTKLSDVIASTIINKVKDRPQEAWDAVHSLVAENKELRSQIAHIRISLEIMKTVMTMKGLDVQCVAEYDKLVKAAHQLKKGS